MAIKPIVSLKETETIQHHTGTLEKQISYQDLVKNWKTYVYTHPTFYKNAEELKHSLSVNSGKVENAIGKKVRLQVAPIRDSQGKATGETIILAVGNGQKGSDKKRAMDGLQKILAMKSQQAKSAIVKQQPDNQAEKTTNKRGAKK